MLLSLTVITKGEKNLEKEKKKIQMPSAMTIVSMILILVAALTWFVPTSVVEFNEDLQQDVITYNASFDDEGNIVENSGKDPAGLWDLILAPIQGFLEAGSISFSIFATGGFLAVLNFTGALDAGIGSLLKRFKGSTLIAFLMLVFGMMGTVYGSWEELPAYALIIIPLFVTAGYDVMVGMMVLFVGAVIGNFASVVNPFAVGAAVSSLGNPELSLGSGIGMRMLMFVVMYALGTFLVIRYANKVKLDAKNSVVYGLDDIKTLVNTERKEMPELTTRRKLSLLVFTFMILVIAVGYIPWSAIPMSDGKTMYDVVNYPLVFLSENVPFIGNLLGTSSTTWFGDWYFDEFSIIFMIGTLIIAFINKVAEKDFVREYIRGCEELFGCVLVLSIAKGVTVLMGTNTAGMNITFVYWLQQFLSNVPTWAFVIAAVGTFMLIGLFIQSTSSVAGITMPILGSLAAVIFSGSMIGSNGGQLVLVSAFTLGINFITVVYPSPTIMGAIQLANVPYDRYLKLILRLIVPVVIAGVVVVLASAYLGFV